MTWVLYGEIGVIWVLLGITIFFQEKTRRLLRDEAKRRGLSRNAR